MKICAGPDKAAAPRRGAAASDGPSPDPGPDLGPGPKVVATKVNKCKVCYQNTLRLVGGY